MKYKGFDYEDGTIVNEAYFDGYAFGDRLLENVTFKATIKNGKLIVSVVESSRQYFSNLNQKKWLKAAKDYAKQNDIFFDTEKGGQDLCLVLDN